MGKTFFVIKGPKLRPSYMAGDRRRTLLLGLAFFSRALRSARARGKAGIFRLSKAWSGFSWLRCRRKLAGPGSAPEADPFLAAA